MKYILPFYILSFLLILSSCKKKYTTNDIYQSIYQNDTLNFKLASKQINLDSLKSENNQTFLHLAIEHNAPDIAEILIKDKRGIDSINGEVDLQFMLGLKLLNTTLVKSKTLYEVELQTSNSLTRGVSPLHYVVYNNDIVLTKSLLKNGADVNIETKYLKDTPLHIAIKNRNSEIIKLLLEYNAKYDIQNINRKTAIDLSTETLDNEIYNLFFKKYSNDDKYQLVTNFMKNEKYIGEIDSLLQRKDITRHMLQESFIFVKDTIIANKILDKGIDVNFISKKWKYGAIHHAAIRGDTTLISFLLKNGANINLLSETKTPETPLFYSKQKYTDFEFVIDKGNVLYNASHNYCAFLGFNKGKTTKNSISSENLLLKNGAK